MKYWGNVVVGNDLIGGMSNDYDVENSRTLFTRSLLGFLIEAVL